MTSRSCKSNESIDLRNNERLHGGCRAAVRRSSTSPAYACFSTDWHESRKQAFSYRFYYYSDSLRSGEQNATDQLPQPLAFPALKSGVDSLPRTECAWHLAPRCSCSHDPPHPLEDLTRIARWTSRGRLLGRQQGNNLLPASRRQGRQPRNAAGVGEAVDRGRGDHGSGSQLERAPPDMATLRLPCGACH